MELRDSLELLSGRGAPAGAAAVVDRAFDAFDAAAVADNLMPSPPRSGARRAVRVTALVATVAIVIGVAGLVRLRVDASRLKRVTLASLVPNSASTGPMNILIVGSDSRANNNPGDAAKFGTPEEVGGSRADVIMVAHVDPARRLVNLLSIPRDLWVPGSNSHPGGRINALGTERLIATIRELLGIDINHYVEVDFSGFRRIVAALGGVRIHFPSPARDKVSGLDVRGAGCIELSPDQALALVRSRHFEYLDAGAWRADPTGDLGRIQRQQEVVRTMLAHLARTTAHNPVSLDRTLRAVADATTIDSTLTTRTLVTVARAFRAVDAAALPATTLETRAATVGGAAVLMAAPGAATGAHSFLVGNVGASSGPPPAPAKGPTCS